MNFLNKQSVLWIWIFLVLQGSAPLFAKVQFVDGTGYYTVTSSNNDYLKYVRYMTVPFNSQTGAVWSAGNDVTGKTPVEIQVIVDNIKALETDPIQEEIFTRMDSTPNEYFSFQDINHAKNTVTQRLETRSMMHIFNTITDGRYVYAEPHKTPPIPVSTTANMWETGKPTNFFFRQKSGTAYDAITQLCDGSSQTKGECWGGISACVWWGASRGMGKDAFNLLYPGVVLDMDIDRGSWNRNTAPAGDGSIHVPGDWLYLKNHNYIQAINYEEFNKKGWIDRKNQTYYWSGENSVYFGVEIYEGLGVVETTEDQMREKLRTEYNADLAQVIANGGKINGVTVVAITELEAPAKIQWVRINRVKN